jgi:hypothetical protein
MYIKQWLAPLTLLMLTGCATLAAHITLDNSVELLKKLVKLTYAQENQTILAQPGQRELLLTLKAEVDGVIRTVSEAEDLSPPTRQQVLAGVLPQLNNSMEKSLSLAKSVAGELYSQSLAESVINGTQIPQKREFGANLLRMYQQLAIIKQKIWLGLDKTDKAQDMAQEYALNMRLMHELCQLQMRSTQNQCLELPSTELPPL